MAAVCTRATFSGTCQLQTITTINGLPSPGPPVAAERSGGGEGRLEQVLQQPFAFQGLVSIISRGREQKGKEGMRSKCMERDRRELIMEFRLDCRLSVFLYICQSWTWQSSELRHFSDAVCYTVARAHLARL